MSMIYVIHNDFHGLYCAGENDGKMLYSYRSSARKFSTMGDLTAFAEANDITGYTAERIEPATIEAMAAEMHEASETRRKGGGV